MRTTRISTLFHEVNTLLSLLIQEMNNVDTSPLSSILKLLIQDRDEL